MIVTEQLLGRNPPGNREQTGLRLTEHRKAKRRGSGFKYCSWVVFNDMVVWGIETTTTPAVEPKLIESGEQRYALGRGAVGWECP